MAWSSTVLQTKEALKKTTSQLKLSKKAKGQRVKTIINLSLITERTIKISQIQIELQQCRTASKTSGRRRNVRP